MPSTGLMTRSDGRASLFSDLSGVPKALALLFLYVGGFASQLKWLICRGALSLEGGWIANAAGRLKRNSTEARRDARGLGSADRRELGPTQGQHSTRPLARAQRTLFRAL
jgi:hypothetical protein